MVAAAALALGSIGISATAAFAQAGYAVTGTVYEGGAWYRSSTVRSMSSPGGNIYLSFTKIPSHGVTWQLTLPAHSNAQMGSTRTYTSLGQQTLATGVATSTQFQNNFRQADTCNFNCGTHDFAGTETY